jgi:hypothetical protein
VITVTAGQIIAILAFGFVCGAAFVLKLLDVFDDRT